MDTPIADFLRDYQREGMARLHMPGHKGFGPMGCEAWDLTEIKGADSLYEADGIIAQSEANAAALFGSRRTFYSTEGSSQCVKAMLYLAVTCRPRGTAPVVLAARNVHKSFVQAAALVDFQVEWLWPEEENTSLCACPITPQGLERALSALDKPPCAVYVTSPDYLGNMLELRALADTAHRHGALLLVDNAHGAYLGLLPKPLHPMGLGVDLCCDSAHKTLPVLTGGAYLHVGRNAPEGLEDKGKQALALFGSTSPSYLILASLDGCNKGLAEDLRRGVSDAVEGVLRLKKELEKNGWRLVGQEPLKVTVEAPSRGWTGPELADFLRVGGVECEYADPDHVVLMASAHTGREDLRRVGDALLTAGERGGPRRGPGRTPPALTPPPRAMSIRRAVFAPSETVAAEESLGRVCASPTVSCPPAVPIAVSGEVITPEALELFRYYGVRRVDVVCRDGEKKSPIGEE